MRSLILACVAGLLLAPQRSVATTKPSFSIDYIVTISDPHSGIATVRWDLAGIDEVKSFALRLRHRRFADLQASGTLEQNGDTARWTPGAPYAHLSYTVKLNHVRGQHGRFDSFSTDSWVVTRARDLFPGARITVEATPDATPKSRARLIFRLPAGWQSAAALPSAAPATYAINQPGKILDRPRGWFALGRFALERQEIGGIMVQIAKIPGSNLAPAETFEFLERTLPSLQKLLGSEPETILIVSAPDPMWHGGLSGAASFYMHGSRPLRTPDKTSPYLHELFHVLQPYAPGADADWIVEGLAEFYSLELQRRAGLINDAAFVRGLGYFQRYGLWDVDLRQQHDNAATNNSAPLVFWALDQRIQRSTSGKMRLDDVIARLAHQERPIDTARFESQVSQVTGKNFAEFFERHVVRGVPPNLGGAL